MSTHQMPCATSAEANGERTNHVEYLENYLKNQRNVINNALQTSQKVLT